MFHKVQWQHMCGEGANFTIGQLLRSLTNSLLKIIKIDWTGSYSYGPPKLARFFEPQCIYIYACCWRCNRRGVVNMVAGGRRPPSRKLWHLYRWSYTAGIRPPSATRDKVTVSVVLQRESDQARSRTIHNHDRSCVYNSKASRYAEDNRTESNCMH